MSTFLRVRAPGLALAVGISGLAWGLAWLEIRLLGNAIVDALVIAILLGMAARALFPSSDSFEAGIEFAAKEVLEVAVFLLGASVDLPLLLAAGPALAVGIVSLVVLGLAVSYGVGRALRLSHPLAVLVASGTSICGNSAIAAVAPVIGATREEVASAVAFTAVLGVVAVLGLPFLIAPLGLSHYQYGVLAGMTVYAVPQVIAASFPVSALAGQVATLVKLVRVLMLGPVVLFFSLTRSRTPGAEVQPLWVRARELVPWFIVGFLVLALLRSSGVIGEQPAALLKSVSSVLTLVAMAGLGLGVEMRSLRRSGARVVVTASVSLLALIAIALAAIWGLDIRGVP